MVKRLQPTLWDVYRALLPWLLLVLVLWWPVAWYSERHLLRALIPQTVIDAAISGLSVVFGAVVGAISIYVGQGVFERRKQRAELMARLPGLTHDANAALAEYWVVQNESATRLISRASPQALRLVRLEGELASFEIAWRTAFRRRRARAAMNKLRRRILAVREYIVSSRVSDEQAEEAFDWILEQADRTANFGSEDAGVSMYDPGETVFVGFRKATDQDFLDLSFEDIPPPWIRGNDPPPGSHASSP